MPSEFIDYAIRCDRDAKYGPIPKGSKCKECGCEITKENAAVINTKPEYVCVTCWDKEGYEYDPTPW